MLNISSNAINLLKGEYRQVIDIRFPNGGTTIKLTEKDIMQGSFKWDRYCATGNMLEIGSAVSSEIEFTLLNTNGFFYDIGGQEIPVEDISFEGKELTVKIGVARSAQGTTEWINIGKFTIMSMPHKFSTIQISALDRMTWFDMFAVGEENPFTRLETLHSLVDKMCTALNILYTFPSTLPNYDLTVDTEIMLEENPQVTYRAIVQWIAALTGTCAYIDVSGELVFRWLEVAAGVTITPHDRFPTSKVYEPVQFTGLTVKKGEDSVVVGGSNLYRFIISDNALIQGENWASTYVEVFNDIWEALHATADPYRPFEASTVPMPYLEPLDVIEYEEKDGTTFNTLITHVTFTLNGKTDFKAVGQSETEANCVTPTGKTAQEESDYNDLKNRIANLENSTIAARERLTSLVQMAIGLHLIEVTDDTGGITYYFTTAAVPAENPTLADLDGIIKDSDVIYMLSSAGWVWCTGANWNVQAQAPKGTWTYGIAKDGTAVLGLINTSGININDESTEYNTSITPETFSAFMGANLIFGFNARLESQINRLLIKSNLDDQPGAENNAYIRLGNAKLIPADDGLDIVYVEDI